MNLTDYLVDALAKAEGIRQELHAAGAKTARLNLATRVYNDLVDMESQRSEARGILEALQEYLAGGRAALTMQDIEDPLWERLSALLAPLGAHLAYVEAYGPE